METGMSQRTITSIPRLSVQPDFAPDQRPALTRQPLPVMSSPVVGQRAPDFSATTVLDGRLKTLSLSAYADAGHWTCLVFFPRAWSYICPTEIRAFSARLEEFLYSRACAVVFVSTDSEHSLRAWTNTSEMDGGLGAIHIPLVSDCNHEISKKYNVLIEAEGVSQRSLFLIDPKGIVRSSSVNDADVGRNVDETLRLIDALQFRDQYGEGCPANWKKGDSGVQFGPGAKVEGPIEVKKTWTDWARPKFARAWSATSGQSISAKSANSFLAPTTPSPVTSPTSGNFNPMEMKFEAALKNQGIGVAT